MKVRNYIEIYNNTKDNLEVIMFFMKNFLSIVKHDYYSSKSIPVNGDHLNCFGKIILFLKSNMLSSYEKLSLHKLVQKLTLYLN